MTGATGNVYAGLHDFEEMGFALHFLRPVDLFADIGANIGSYTILASGVVGANTLSFEPVPSTYGHLKDNIAINHIEDKVQTMNIGLGEKSGMIRISFELDTVNHVLTREEENLQYIEVPAGVLDDYCTEVIPALLKIDVEGFEYLVLKGGLKTLLSPELKAMIIELNGSAGRYGIDDDLIHNYLVELGFLPYTYFPFERRLNLLSTYKKNGNTIYLRDMQFVAERVDNQRKIKILDIMV
ncbi:MAG: FkbM family methyltransferase [Bacteroidia bacterium]|nr:FkbM family methyltransferase [Bacteroidia bacterium]